MPKIMNEGILNVNNQKHEERAKLLRLYRANLTPLESIY
jgi:hypothetical protein